MKGFDIITDARELSKKCKTVTLDEGLQIGAILKNTLNECPNGVGLAANQIGIDARVCLIRVKESILLVNPEIVFETGETSFEEGCLSFPGDYILTRRFNLLYATSKRKDSI